MDWLLSPWFIFLASATVVVVAAVKLAEYGDVIATRTGLGGLFVGTVFLAGATSLPEIIASISSFAAGVPNLAAGNFFGSNMINMLLLALADLINVNEPLLRRVAVRHALTAALAITLMAMAVIFIMADFNFVIGWVGVDSLLIIAIFAGGLWVIQQQGQPAGDTPETVEIKIAPQFPSLRWGVIGFVLSALILAAVVPQMVWASAEIAVITGLGAGFVGTIFLGLVTSLPELLAVLAAIRIGALDMAVGNLFGSNVFNMLALGIADFFYLNGRFLGDIDPNFALAAMLGLLLTNMALMGNLARVRRVSRFMAMDAVAIILVYLGGVYLLYTKGIGL